MSISVHLWCGMKPHTDDETRRDGGDDSATRRFPRRTVLRVAGASAALSLGSGAVTATGDDDSDDDYGHGSDGSAAPTHPEEIDPIFGYASAAENPCSGEASDDCFESFAKPVRPAHEVEMQIDVPELLLAIAGQGGLSETTTANVTAAVEDGSVDEGELDRPGAGVSVGTPEGTETVTVREIAHLLADTTGFRFEPAGLRVSPGDVVLYSAETPDHAVTAYHERHGRQNRVPDGVEPVSSPLVPVGGYWLYRFEEEGVYDFNCPPHEPFGMVHRVVVTDEEDDAAEPSVENTGRPPEEENALGSILAGLDPNVPSAHDALESDALHPERIASRGTVSWDDVVDDHRTD